MWAGLVTLTLAVGASAEKLVQVAVPANQCAGACKDAVTAVRFGDSKPDLDYYNNLLQSKYFLSSMALCLDTYCSKAKEEEAWHIMLDSALEYGDPKPTDLPTLEYARSLINHSSILEMDANNPPAPIINSTILTTQQNFDDSERTERVWTQQMIYVGRVIGSLTPAPCLRVGSVSPTRRGRHGRHGEPPHRPHLQGLARRGPRGHVHRVQWLGLAHQPGTDMVPPLH